MTRTVRARRLLVGMALVATAPFLSPPPAGAQEVTVEDPTGDVWLFEESSEEPVPAPTVTDGDIVRTRFEYRVHKVVITSRYVELTPGGRSGVYGLLKTDGGQFFETLLRVGPRNPDGVVRVFDNNRPSRDCRTSHHINYDTNLMSMSVSRGCLRYPTWVRATGFKFRATRAMFTIDSMDTDQAFPENFATKRLYRD